MDDVANSPARFAGLSEAEAQARLTAEGYNELPRPDRRTPFRIVLEVVREPMLALLIAGGLVLFYRGGGHMPRLFRTEPLPATTAKDARSTRSEKGLEGRPRRLRSPKLTTLRRTPKACSAFSL